MRSRAESSGLGLDLPRLPLRSARSDASLRLPSARSDFSLSEGFRTETSKVPFDWARAVSTDWVNLSRSGFARTMTLSTTISKLCHWFLFSAISSCRSRVSPSTRILANPSRRAESIMSRCSPFMCVTIGASMSRRLPSSSVSIESTICCTDWRSTGRPQLRQCGRPARANNNRR